MHNNILIITKKNVYVGNNFPKNNSNDKILRVTENKG